MGMELFGMKSAVNGGDGGEAQVEELEGLMRRMVAIKGGCCDVVFRPEANCGQKRVRGCLRRSANDSLPRRLMI